MTAHLSAHLRCKDYSQPWQLPIASMDILTWEILTLETSLPRKAIKTRDLEDPFHPQHVSQVYQYNDTAFFKT